MQVRELRALLAPAVEALGFELWGVEYITRGRHRLLRVYIDGPEGVTVDDCAAVSHQVSGVLDVEDPIPGEYTLEVSSPGMDRTLFEPEQYARFEGSLLNLRLAVAFQGRRKVRGRIKAADDKGVLLVLEDGSEHRFAFADIEKATIEPEFPGGKR